MHNYRRSRLAMGLVRKDNGNFLRSATNIKKLKYSCDLERTAITVANRCSTTSQTASGVQENFYRFSKALAQYRVNAIEVAIKHWWSQVRLRSINIGMLATLRNVHVGTPIMSFIKMAWAATTEIGCAVSERPYCGSDWVAVCHYRTGTFLPGMTVYTPGATCASCINICDNGLCPQ